MISTAIDFASRHTLEQISLALAILSSVVLLVAGVELLRRGRSAIGLARIAGVATICSFVFVGLTSPMLSVLAMLLGTVFSAGMLVYLFMNRGDQDSRPVTS